MDQKSQAERERAAWEALTPEQRREFQGDSKPRWGQDMYAKKMFGVPQGYAKSRLFLLNGGSESDPLWKAIAEEGLPLSTAERILRHSRAQHTSVESMLKRWRMNSRGIFTRKSAPEGSSTEHLRKQLAEVMAAFVATRRGDIAEDVRKQAVLDLSTEAAQLVSAWLSQMRHQKVGRRDLTAACHMLGMPVPGYGAMVDLKRARKAQRALAKTMHPDAVGNESMVASYRAINDAYGVLAAYNDSIQGAKNNEEQDDGST